MKPLGSLVETILRGNNLWLGYKQHIILEEWPLIVGAQLATVSKATGFNKTTLRVKVKDSVWAYHLSLLKPGLIKKTNHYTKMSLVSDIFFYVGDLDT